MNIIVSSWPGAGGTTLALLLAYYLNYTLFRGSQTNRLLGEKLGFKLNGEDRIKADSYLDKYWGPVYDKYVDYILVHKDNYLIESDLAAFRIGLKDNIFSIFLAPSLESRQKRLITDGRPEEAPLLAKREQKLQADYKNYGINWLDLNAIMDKYNLVVDSSDMSIALELEYIYAALGKNLSSNKAFFDIETEYWSKGKAFYSEALKKQGILISTESIIQDVVATFPEDTQFMPPELRDIICNI